MNKSALPRTAQEKLAALAIAADDARTLAFSSVGRSNQLREQLNVTSDPREHGGIETELSRLRASQQQHSARHGELSNLRASANRWLAQLPAGAVLELAKPVAPKLHDGEDTAQAIERLRDEIAEAQDKLRAVKAAPWPKADLKKADRDYVKRLAEKRRPNIRVTDGRFDINFDDPTAHGVGVDTMLSLLAWFDGPHMVERLEAAIDELPPPKLALTASERADHVRELSADIDRLERMEEALIERAASEGRTIARRPVASPAAILGVKVKRQQRAEAA